MGVYPDAGRYRQTHYQQDSEESQEQFEGDHVIVLLGIDQIQPSQYGCYSGLESDEAV